MTDPESWETTNERGPFVTIHAGGPLDGIVAVTAVPDGHGRTRVIASWIRYGQTHWHWVEVDSFEEARALAHSIADQFVAGTPPDVSRD